MSKRILVVEDQPDNRQIIRDMLAGTDYEVTEAEDGEQALAAVAKARPDLILMGIQLPIMDGYEVTRQIKADPAMRYRFRSSPSRLEPGAGGFMCSFQHRCETRPLRGVFSAQGQVRPVPN